MISVEWFKDLPKAEQEEFKKLILGSQKVLDKLHSIVYNKALSRKKVQLKDYESPSWSHRQAHINGEIAALEGILELLKISDKEG